MVNKCQKHKERLLKEANERYQDFSAEEKDERLRKAQERYQNFTREKKKRGQYYQEHKKKLPDYRRNYYLAHKKL